ncbi:MAG TPA: hypothetical protein VGC37_16825, partial [Friedmanniella sp.]
AMGGGSAASAGGIPAASGSFTAPPKIDVQAEIEQQSRADEEASRKTVAEAIAAAQELERPAVRPHQTAPAAPALTDGHDGSSATEPSPVADAAVPEGSESTQEAVDVQR